MILNDFLVLFLLCRLIYWLMAGFLFVCASGWNMVKSGRLSYINNLKSWFTVSLPQGADIPSEKGDTDAYKTQNF